MDRNIIYNDIALPEGTKKNKLKPISIGTLAILERLGCRSTAILMGLKEGNLLENLEDLLLILYVHDKDDQELAEIVDRLYEDPQSICKESILYGTSKTTEEIGELMSILLYDKERIEVSNTESIKSKSTYKSKNE